MTKQNKKGSSGKVLPKKYTVIRLSCDNCGEDVYYILNCQHCGGDLAFTEALQLDQTEIKKLAEEAGKDIKGDVRHILTEAGDIDDIGTVETTIGTLEVDEVDDLYKGPFSPL